MGSTISSVFNNADGQVEPPPGYSVPSFPSLYPPVISGGWGGFNDGYFLYYADDIWHFTLYWHLILHSLIFALPGLYFSLISIFSFTSSVSIRSTTGIWRTRTDFRTNTQIAEEGVLVGDGEGGLRIEGRRRGSRSRNEAAKGAARRRAVGIGGDEGQSGQVRSRAGSAAYRDTKHISSKSSTPHHNDSHPSSDNDNFRDRKESTTSQIKATDFALPSHDNDVHYNEAELRRRQISTTTGTSTGTVGAGTMGTSSTTPLIAEDDHNRDEGITRSKGKHRRGLYALTSHSGSNSASKPQTSLHEDPPTAHYLSRPISHTDVPLPNQSQLSIPRERGEPIHTLQSRGSGLERARSRVHDFLHDPHSRSPRKSGEGVGKYEFHPLQTFRSLLPHEDQANVVLSDSENGVEIENDPVRSEPVGKPQHSRRPAPFWLGLLPFPIFAAWGLTTALIMGTIVGFTLSAVYNTAGFEMSTWVPFLWAVIETTLVVISSYSTITSIL